MVRSQTAVVLPPTRDENVSSLFNEQLGTGQRKPLDPPVITATLPSSFPTITPFSDYLAGELKHLVKAGEHCEGIHDRLISTGPG